MTQAAPSVPSPRTRRFVSWAIRHGKLLWAVALLLSVWAFWRTAHLYMTLRSDLEDLLPGDAPSVLALKELRRRLPGIQFLGVVVDAGDAKGLPAAERFVDDLAARIRAYPPAWVTAVRTGVTEERDFLEAHALLYVDVPDLEEVRRRIEARRDYEVTRAMEADITDEGPPPLDFSDIEQRYRSKVPDSAERFRNGRFTNEAEHTTVLLVETNGYSTGTEKAQALVRQIHEDIRALREKNRYAPQMRAGLTGDPVILAEELSALVTDLTFSSIVVVTAVIMALMFYYRWWRAVPALVLPLMLAAGYSFALASLPPFSVTALNSNTGFLGSIIVGNGINYGIILLARYVEERRRGCAVREALEIAVYATRSGTVIAAAAAAIAYGSLMSTQFRGFWQFGVIGGIGMFLCWGVTFVLMPSLVTWLDRSDQTAPRPRPAGRLTPAGAVAWCVSRFPGAIVVAGLGLTILAAAGSSHFGRDRFETDFTKLRRRDSAQVGHAYWGKRMDAVLQEHLSPVAILADTPEQTAAIAGAIRQAATSPPLHDVVDSVRTVDDILPSDQSIKVAKIQAIQKMLTPKIRSLIPAENRDKVDRVLAGSSQPMRAQDLPPSFTVGLREWDNTLNRTVLVYLKPSANTWESKSFIDFAERLRETSGRFPGPGGRVAMVAGQAPLSADLVASMLSDGPRATALALIGVLALLVAMFRFRREMPLVLGSLVVGVLWLTYSTFLLNVKINFCNFVSFPITFGIGVDYAANVMWRYHLDGRRDVLDAVRSTGGAVGLCSATTVIGYSSLLFAKNQGLFSFGLLAVIGEIACLVSGVVLLPAVLVWLRKRRAPG